MCFWYWPRLSGETLLGLAFRLKYLFRDVCSSASFSALFSLSLRATARCIRRRLRVEDGSEVLGGAYVHLSRHVRAVLTGGPGIRGGGLVISSMSAASDASALTPSGTTLRRTARRRHPRHQPPPHHHCLMPGLPRSVSVSLSLPVLAPLPCPSVQPPTPSLTPLLAPAPLWHDASPSPSQRAVRAPAAPTSWSTHAHSP
jgi:hypothetical protein